MHFYYNSEIIRMDYNQEEIRIIFIRTEHISVRVRVRFISWSTVVLVEKRDASWSQKIMIPCDSSLFIYIIIEQFAMPVCHVRVQIEFPL